MASLSPAPVSQFFDANGNPLAGGKLYTYATGTTTPLATYTARAGAANTNPIILNYRGEANIWLTNKLYTFVLKNAFDETIWTVDGIGNVASGFFNVMDYGAIGNGVADDTAAFKATIIAATAGGVIYAPAGSYKLTANLDIVWPKLCVLRGDGSKLTTLLDYRTDASVGGLINYNGSSFAGGDNAYMSTWTGGFTLTRSVNQTVVTGDVITTMGTGKGLYLNGVVAGVYSDIAARGYETNIYAVDCLGFAMRDLYLNQCNYGIYLAGYAALSGPNASVIDNAIISACGTWGIYVSGGMMQITGGTYAFCGTMGTTSGAIYAGGDTSLALPQDIMITGGFFEANRGSADVYIENRIATAFSASVNDCLFSRTSGAYFTTHNIYALNVGAATMQLVASGNGFRGYNTYVADAGRKYIATSGLVEHSYIGNTYTNTLEAPTLTATNFSVLGWGANGGQLVDVGGVPYAYTSTTSIGIGNTTGGVVLDATAWRPAIAGAFKLGTTTYPFSEVHFGALGGQLIDITGAPTLYAPTTSVGLANATGEMVLDATAWRPAIAGTFGIGTASYPVDKIYFGALGGRLLDISGAPYFYTSSTSIGLGNSTGGIVLDASAWRPAIANTFAIGTATYPFASAAVTGTFTWGGYGIPAPTGSTTTYLRNDGTWGTPSGSSSTDYTYTGVVTGLTTSPTGTVKYTRVGSIVTMDLFGVVGTSNATTMTITGGTASMRPAVDKQVLMGVIDGGINFLGLAVIRTTGVIDFYKNIVGDPFQSTGVKGFANNSISYTVA